MFKSIFATIIKNIQKSLGKGSDWIIDSVIDHTIDISQYNPLAREGLINTQNTDDNECFKWCLVRYLTPHAVRITCSRSSGSKNYKS